MAELEQLHIQLHPDLAADLRAAVADGEFADVNEAVQVALEAWQTQRALDGWDVNELRRLVQEGIDSGPGIPAEEVFAELRSRIAAM